MVCCVMPCIAWLQKRVDLGLTGTICCFVVTEIIRWLVCIIPIYLAAWRYAELVEYTVFIPGSPIQQQYWGVVTGIVLAVTIFIYLPLKVAAICFRLKHRLMEDLAWRPAVLFYLCFSVLPCLTIITVAAHQVDIPTNSLDATTITVLHGMVLGLTFTEWLSKIREELVTYDLISVMAEDFFFAYDVIEFISLPTGDPDIYNSNWAYACLVFAFVAMFKYIPANPTSLDGAKATKGKVISLVVNMVCCDIPFMIIRICTLVVFKFSISDLIYPVKNVALILFACTQLYMISRLVRERKQKVAVRKTLSVDRLSRHPECREDDDGKVVCERQDSSGVPTVTEARTDADGKIWMDGPDGGKIEGVMIKRKKRRSHELTARLHPGNVNEAFNKAEHGIELVQVTSDF